MKTGKRKRRGILKAVLTVMLSFAIVMGMIPGTDLVIPVHANGDKTITGLGTGAIGNPTSGAGGWSYVYYGTYDTDNDPSTNPVPVKYRVLDKAATEYTSTDNPTMLLDCNRTLAKHRFDDDSKVWAESEIRGWLNGNDFLNKDSVFTAAERAAIASSTKENPSTNDGNGWAGALDWAPLTGEKIFLLDAKEATRPSYGYVNTDSSNRSKTGADAWWWLRSPYHSSGNYTGSVDPSGNIDYDHVYDYDGVSPVLNIDLSSVIFSSVISGDPGNSGTEYKLTIADAGLGITPGTITRSGTTVTVPYTITGANSGNATQVSVLITDEEYSEGTASDSGYTYMKLSGGVSGSGTFTLPAAYEDKTCGTNYYAYILAEDVKTGNATDYACTPVEITIPDSSGPGPGPAPSPNPSHNDGDSSDNDPSDSGSQPKDEKPFDYLDELRAKLKSAIDLGGDQTVTWDKGTALPYDIMKTLQDNPNITLVFSYTYQGKDYKVTIPGRSVKADPKIPWYGPLNLYGLFGAYSAVTPVTSINTKTGSRTYTVIAGDTLSEIARELGTTVSKLVELNNIENPDRISIGQVIRY